MNSQNEVPGNIKPMAEDPKDKIREFGDLEDKTPSGQPDLLENTREVSKVDSKDTKYAHGASVNLEASLTSEDVIRAGGFGATDDISSFLPVASDFTDFEANLRDAREYEDLNEKISHPGLGWTNDSK